MTVTPILPGATLGVLGSGQLGRMFAAAARQMGYRVHVLSPDADSPTGQLADHELVASYDDLDAVRRFAQSVDVITFEFENVPAATAAAAAELVPVRPDGQVLHVAQQRAREKTFLRDRGFPVTPFVWIRSEADLEAAAISPGLPGVLKTARFGYDGKGQEKVESPEMLRDAWTRMGRPESVLERFIEFERELSVVTARGVDGWMVTYPVLENAHADHILDVSVMPADVSPVVERHARQIAEGILEALEVVGVMCVELFLTRDGELLINEIAPRPHNSGHLTIEACMTSQFEQQVRAVCGLAAGSIELLRPAAMANLLGDLWEPGTPDWAAACAIPGVHLHLYGKTAPRPRRKMGHITALADTADEARRLALRARQSLVS